MYPAKKAYLDRAKQPRNLNLEIRDISGTTPLPYADRIQQKILNGNNDRSRSPNQRFQAIYKPTSNRIPDELPRQNPDILISTQPTKEPVKQTGRTPSPVYAPTTGRRYNQHNPSMLANNPLANYADVSPARNNQANRQNDATSTKSKGEARSMTPEYKFIGKSEKKSYANKADLRYEVSDINQKKSRWAHLIKPNQKEIDQVKNYKHLQQLDKYDRGISPGLITKEVEFKNGHRIDAPKIPRSNSQTNVQGPLYRPTVYDYANPVLKNFDQNHYIKKQEAEFFMQNNPMILRGANQLEYKPTRTQATQNLRSYRY
jgi:hypothetical protein